MRVEVRNLRNTELCKCENSELLALVSYLNDQSFDVSSAIPASGQIKAQLNDYFEQNNWSEKFVFDGNIPKTINRANFTLDGIKDLAQEIACEYKHRFFLEACFDNRQAIGTNLLKFVTAQNKYEEKASCRGLAFLICGDKRTLKNLGWDGSIGSSEEYEFALRNPYQQILKYAPILLVLRG